jgi:hypothetical protein
MLRKFFKKGKKGKKVSLKKDDHVRHDWLIALLAFFVAILVVISISAFIFLRTESAEVGLQVELKDESLINQELLDETLFYYKTKEENFLKYERSVPEAPQL